MTTLHATTHTIGTSVQGRPLRLTLLGAGQPPEAPLRVLYIGAFHGDEAISARLLEQFLAECQKNPGQMPKLTGPIGILPMLNPDGVAANTRTNANGVDLNRNWPTQNWRQNHEQPGSAYYGGAQPASEPETQALLACIEQLKPQIIVSIHSPYRVINYDGPAPQTLALAEAMAACNGYPVTASIGYPTPGSFGTWAGLEQQIPTLTLELPDLNEPSPGYPATPDALDARVWQENAPALMACIAN
ncbi:MAG: M14 family zinc carboxypeptidase [Vampirovibrionales bacterium]|nr:M14 family zinc carboxypeptidase [Vampirovibrionales bacterium]